MKEDVFHGLITARILLEDAERLCRSDDSYVASAGLVVLQDALELTLYCTLMELGVDEKKTIEDLRFRELIGEVKAATGKPLSKNGTLKALNEQRRTVKHLGQLVEPKAVRNFYSAAVVAIDELLSRVVGKSLKLIMLDELVRPGKSKDHLVAAQEALAKGKPYEALLEIRKALFLEIEVFYAIDKWEDVSEGMPAPLVFTVRGRQAPYYTKNKEWIQKNVHEPCDYIRLDHDALRLDLMEWGFPTQDFWNLWRLTPSVFQFDGSSEWHLKEEVEHWRSATEEIASYCLDRAISLITTKQRHRDLIRSHDMEHYRPIDVRLIREQAIFEDASSDSKVSSTLPKGMVFGVKDFIDGFDGEKYYLLIEKVDGAWHHGYIPADSCEVVEDEVSEG